MIKNQNNIKLNLKDYVDGVLSGNRSMLARAITLIESSSPAHIEDAQKVLQQLISHTKKQKQKNGSDLSIRIGITGAPGAGKSTFIDSFGTYLCDKGHKVAVLAVDPSSSLSKGSILGDKTRMENLSKHPNAFIRPSPSGGTLGGVAKNTRESIIICEAAGFDIIIVETIGVGQSEIAVRSMVDFFLLLLLPGGGDELQGIKKGSVELADAIVVNKADGDNVNLANITKSAYEQSVHYLQPATPGWMTGLFTVSAINNVGIDSIWLTIEEFVKLTKNSGEFDKRRNSQLLEWTHAMLNDQLKSMFYNNEAIKKKIKETESMILNGKITPVNAVTELLEKFLKNI